MIDELRMEGTMVSGTNTSNLRGFITFILFLLTSTSPIYAGEAYALDITKIPNYEQIIRKRQIFVTEPKRIEGALRDENISDQEILEIQKASLEVMPGAIVNIGGVTTSCPCEYGASCSAQVWIVTTRLNESTGFMLSKLRGHWVVGPIQSWWFRYQKHRDKLKTFTNFQHYADEKAKREQWEIEEQALIHDFPAGQCDDKQKR